MDAAFIPYSLASEAVAAVAESVTLLFTAISSTHSRLPPLC